MPHTAIFGETKPFSEAPAQFITPVDMFAALEEMRPDGLLATLRAVHPVYAEKIGLWRMLGDVALGRVETDADKRRYLVRGRSELDWAWDQRVKLSAFLPESPGLLSDFVGALFSKGARREFAETADEMARERLQAFIDEAGPDGQPLTAIAREAARLALVYESVDAFLDHPADEETPTPRVVLYTPEQRLDWQLGEDGRFAWVKYRESFGRKDGPFAERIRVDEYRIVTPEEVRLFRVTKKGSGKPEIEVLEPIPHPFDSIPVRTLFWKKLDEGEGESWARPLVMADIKTFRQESDLVYDVFKHAHPLLKIWQHREDGEADIMREIKLGGAYAIPLDPGGEDGRAPENVEYLDLPIGELSLQSDLAKETRQQARRLAGNAADMETATGTRPESGVALAYRQAQRAKNFVQMARNLQEWEWQLLELVANEGIEQPVDLSGLLEVTYPDRFDQRLVEELDRNLQISREIASQTLVAEVRKQMAGMIVGDGITAETQSRINEEIDAPDSPSTDSEEGTVTALTLALERAVLVGDLELANAIRERLAQRLGAEIPSPWTRADIQAAREHMVSRGKPQKQEE